MLPVVQAEPLLYSCGSKPDAAAASVNLSPSVTPDSHVDDLSDIFFGVDVAVQAYARTESCELHLEDTWRGRQDTMSVTTPIKKNRKKSESKPQSQINKCHNEKRRRELENETINQLEELLTSCLAEVKQPDKNGIVREATQQIQAVLRRRTLCPGECPLRANDASCLPANATAPARLQHALHYSELTTLIETLKHYTSNFGWILLELNAKGEIECVTDNIKDLIQQERTELYKKSFFSILHSSDHAKLRPLLRSVQTFSWGTGEIDKFQAIKARLHINNSNGNEGASEYVEGVIHAAPVRGSSSEQSGSVMCVIRRCEDATSALSVAGPPPPPAIATASAVAVAAAHTPDNIVFRLDCNFTVLTCDLSGVENYIDFPVSLVGARYLDLVESSDRARIAAHLQETTCFPAPPAVSDPFKLRVAPDKPPVRVVARSRLFRAQPTSGEPDFIMSSHSVLGDDEPDIMDPPRPAIGGPLMPSVNGDSEPRYQSLSPAEPQFSINDFDLEQWTSPYQTSEMSSEDSKDRKEGEPSRLVPTESPAEEPNRLRSLLSKKPETTNCNNILKDLLKQEDEDMCGTDGSVSAPHTPHTPHTPQTPLTPAAALSPLHTAQAHARPPPPHTPHASHSSQHQQPQHQQPQHHNNNSDVLLRILNEKTDEENDDRNRSGNERGAGGVGQPSALLSQLLLSNNNGPTRHEHDTYLERMTSNALKRRLDDKAPIVAVKRAPPTSDNHQVSSSAASTASSSASSTAVSPSTSSAGMSPLCQKNQILVSLLAKQQTVPPPPPAAGGALRPFGPTARPRAQPPQQHHQQHAPLRHGSALSNMLQPSRPNVNGGGGMGTECATGAQQQSHLQMVLQGGGSGGVRGAYPLPHSAPSLHYANTPPHHAHYITHTQPTPSGSRREQASAAGVTGAGDAEPPSDQTLSDILDEVIESMPDADRPAPDVSALCDLEPAPMRTDYAGVKEKNAMINAIRINLMQCETVTKSPVSSPGTPPVYPVQSPQGNCGMSGGAVYRVPGGGGGGGERARAPTFTAEQQRTRLLHMQRSQQMLVSPEAAEQPQQDLGSTISALVSANVAPPNVALTRLTDYHQQHYHPTNQMGANYGTNKMPSNQQNPMLSRQLSGSGAGGGYTHGAGAAHSAAALHTPMSQQPYHRAPRPHLVRGYYDDGSAGYCGEYPRRPPSHHPHVAPSSEHLMPCAGSGGGGGVSGGAGGATSEYVRNELRAVVGARQRPELHAHAQPDLDTLIAFDMPTPGGVTGEGAGAAGASWEPAQPTNQPQERSLIPNTTGAAGSAGAASAVGGDETRAAGAASKASLLQKLLSQ